jgi:hypothetical protein
MNGPRGSLLLGMNGYTNSHPWRNHVSGDQESEHRIVHELKIAEFPRVRFSQKATMLSRYLPLDFPSWVPQRQSLLPIGKIIVGPGQHTPFTRLV